MAEFAVVAGVGAAVVFGWGCGVASADKASESSGATGSSASASTGSSSAGSGSGSSGSGSSGSGSSGSGSTSTGQRHGRDRDDDGPGDDAGVTDDAGVSDDAEELTNDSDVGDVFEASDIGDRDGVDTGLVDGDVRDDSAVLDDSDVLEDSDVLVDSAFEDDGALTEAEAGTGTEAADGTGIDTNTEPDVTDGESANQATTDVAVVATAAVGPGAPANGDGPPPTDPAALPQAWVMTAAARRELEPTAKHQSAPVDTDSTGEALATPGAAENTVSYTAPPSLFDKVVVAGLNVLKGISKLIGVDLYGVFGTALTSDRPPSFLTRGLHARLTEYEVSEDNSWRVWEFEPLNPTGKAVVAVHGGGFILEPNVMHWMDYTSMARDTGATVIVPLYPLATSEAGSATRVVPAMAQFLSDQIAQYGADNVSVYADSAGPILALSAVRQLVLAGKPLPASMVLLSFAPDATLSNPAIRDIKDPVFDLDDLDFYANRWTAGLALTDPLINIMSFEDAVLAALPSTTIYVGSLEFALPDTLALQQKWSAAGGAVSTVVGQGQIHDWALAGSPNSQASTVRPDIYRQLGLNGVAAGPRTITTGPPSYSDRLVADTLRFLRWFSETTGISLFSGVVGSVTSTDPPRLATLGLTVTEREFNGWTVWELAPPQPSGEYVVALHGGGFAAEANILHWSDYGQMARDTGATVLVPIYPLAPPLGTGTATTLVPPMADYLSLLIDAHGVDNVSVYGDSSGGSFAVLAVQELIRRCRAAVACVLTESQPSRMVLVSPALHITLRTPEVEAIDDPILPRWDPDEIPGYNGELDMDDYRVNPISSDDLTGLPTTAMYIGTQEQLYPGALAFRDKLLAQDPDADFTVIIGDGQLHGWALGGLVINSQAPIWRSTVYRQLGLFPEVNSARIATVAVA
ncbi:alpha/beta hydrolase fold domain-containing protein [Mycolicibacterium sp. OfavD-34-C]|uniref:alpha/beta hydrolase fold domain-containing protein n=1 Tax=Mycolicibacterium sp. OfavD-34-C TaxID=2917746 RepID=UPI001EF54447|nr:alpha/beta hydrolase [Mycolicibacterium sp. OfavD-34-C]MCG7580026.1 alpha/beta hydrolase [Mycolicibacterium sp. OfavD-34-C]